jgi:hypothetical protein
MQNSCSMGGLRSLAEAIGMEHAFKRGLTNKRERFDVLAVTGRAMVRSDEIIEAVVASLRADTPERDKHVLRETLRGLVRLAQIEQMVAISEDFQTVERITHQALRRSRRQRQ